MKELRSHCRRYLGLTEDDLDYVLDEATEQNAHTHTHTPT
eukprot:COSAG03_NODE_16767_length_392_cov_4.590444_1_plen_39_part_10